MRFTKAREQVNGTSRIARSLEGRLDHPHFGELLTGYWGSGLAPPHLISELETNDEGKLWSCLWEAMLFHHLTALGHSLRKITRAAGQYGPDFSFDYDGKTVWLEAVVPAPVGIPADWLSPPGREVRVRSKPDQERVLRCTSCISDKQQKFKDYLEKEIVGSRDITIIAVNICRLSDFDIDGCGISQFPLAMEALFPIGPIAVPITREGKQAGPAINVPRLTVEKVTGAKISTANFLNPEFTNVSAVVQAHQKDMHERDLVLALIHNPLANNKLDATLLKARSEYVATEQGDTFFIANVAATTRSP